MKAIEELIKGGILTEIEIDKVSLVKSPANQRRFIFTKQAKIEFTGSTDQTFDGTTITVNGEELEDLESFHFSAVNWTEEQIEEWGATPVSLSFSTKKSTTDGLDVIETFSLHSEVKKEMEKSEILKAIKEGLGIELDEAGFDKLSVEKQKALEGLAFFTPVMNGQPAFRDAVKVLVKSATESEAEAEEATSEEAETVDPVLLAIAGLKSDIDALKAKASETSESSEENGEESAEESGDSDSNDAGDSDEADAGADEAGDDTGDDTASEPVTKADLEAFGKQLKIMDTRQLAIAKAAGMKESAEIEVQKAAEEKDDYDWGGADLQ